MNQKINGPHVSVFYGTARMNLRDFIPMQETYKSVNGNTKNIDCNINNITGIVFARMSVSRKDGIDYEVTYPEKDNDLPILVSVQEIKLDRPVQIAGRHMCIDNPEVSSDKPYGGGPGKISLSDELAEALIRDAIKANPALRNKLEKFLKHYVADDEHSEVIHDSKNDSGCYPVIEDYENARRKLLREGNTENRSLSAGIILNTMCDEMEKTGRRLADDWRSVTLENIKKWSKK